jgi:hypothetical protein
VRKTLVFPQKQKQNILTSRVQQQNNTILAALIQTDAKVILCPASKSVLNFNLISNQNINS